MLLWWVNEASQETEPKMSNTQNSTIASAILAGSLRLGRSTAAAIANLAPWGLAR